MLLRHLGRLDDGERGLLANARCLAEGVDVPTLDGVAFIDPRRSEVDIVQAVGRAIRLAPDKTVGTIVIPVFIDTDEDPETALDDSAFKPVWDVIKALRSHDDELGEQLDSLRLGLGLRGGGQPRLPEKIHLDLPTHISADFARAFNIRLVDSVTAPWLEWYGRNQEYYKANGTANAPMGYKTPEGHPLGWWGNSQRDFYRRGKLSAERIKLLDDLGDWSWEPREGNWMSWFEKLREHYKTIGTTVISQKEPLGRWTSKQRAAYRRGTLSAERIKLLDDLGDD